MLAAGAQVRAHPWYPALLVLILLGALTKSAQFPFHFWLPNALFTLTVRSVMVEIAELAEGLADRFEPALCDAYARLFAQAISYALQYGVPLQVLVDKFSHARFEPSGMTKNPEVRFAKSIVDYVFRWLGSKFLSGDDRPIRRRLEEQMRLAAGEKLGYDQDDVKIIEAIASFRAGGYEEALGYCVDPDAVRAFAQTEIAPRAGIARPPRPRRGRRRPRRRRRSARRRPRRRPRRGSRERAARSRERARGTRTRRTAGERRRGRQKHP